jgi:hypothetical protein
MYKNSFAYLRFGLPLLPPDLIALDALSALLRAVSAGVRLGLPRLPPVGALAVLG